MHIYFCSRLEAHWNACVISCAIKMYYVLLLLHIIEGAKTIIIYSYNNYILKGELIVVIMNNC